MTSSMDHIEGHTYHGRHGGLDNAFRYSVDYILLDPEADLKMPWLFSRNRSNLVSLWDRDNGGVPKSGRGVHWARQVFGDAQVEFAQIKLLTQPRVLGHVFNPVSFWLAFDARENLVASIAEVTNTFGDRHSYLVRHEDGSVISPKDEMTARKLMHVSPFQPVEGEYRFHFDIGKDKIGIRINYIRSHGGVIATLVGQRKPMTSGSLVRMFLRRPFGSRRVLALIHWQALKLFLKGASYASRPHPPKAEVS